MGVDGGTPLNRVTPASGANTVRPADRREGRQEGQRRQQEEPQDTVELSDRENLAPSDEPETSDEPNTCEVDRRGQEERALDIRA